MSVLRMEASGPVPARLAWLRYLEPDRWTAWAPQLSRVEYALPEITTGSTGRVFGPFGVWARFEIGDVDNGARTWAWTVNRGPLTLRLEHGVEAAGAGSRTWLVLHGPGPVIALYGPLARYALHRLVTKPG